MRLYKIFIILMAVLLISTNVFAGSSPADVPASDDEKTSEYKITFDVNNYSNGSTVSIKIANTSSMDISNWKLVIALNNNSLITNSWCAKYYQSDSQITITPESWNNKITAGSSICLGFNTNSNTSISSSYIFESPDLANNTTTNNNTNNTNVNITTNLIDANKNFAFDLLKKLNDDESGKNLFFSPISVSTALSMLYEGAENSTKDGIAKTLNYDGITITDLNNSYKSLIENLNRKDEHVNLNLGNSIWIREGFNVNSNFINTTEDVFKSQTQNLDFNNPDAADVINTWISDATNGMIDSVINPPISQDIMMYLINAIYFKGNWTKPFNPESTRESTFTTENNESKIVDMMSRTDTTYFAKGTDYSAISLPYGDGTVNMYFVMPSSGTSIDSFIKTLDVNKFNEIKQNLQPRSYFSIRIPKYKMEYGTKSLKNILIDLGMADSFGSSANFSGIANGLYVDDVLHKAIIDVNETGTEAAATTVVVMPTSIQQDNFYANRPFLFIIEDSKTDTILFMGKAADLSK